MYGNWNSPETHLEGRVEVEDMEFLGVYTEERSCRNFSGSQLTKEVESRGVIQ